MDEGFEVSESILKLKVLETPRRLPRPLSGEQVRRLERSIQAAITDADSKLKSAVRDLVFYLLCHCALRISEVCHLQLIDIELQECRLFIRNSKERKDRIAYMSDTAAMALQQHLAIRLNQDAAYVFATRHRSITPHSLRRRLVLFSQQCGILVIAQILRHTFDSQLLAASMPVTSLQRYLGQEHLDTTMICAEVSDRLLRQDYYQGIATLDPGSGKLSMSGLGPTQQYTLRQLVEELKTPGLEQSRHDEILDLILVNIWYNLGLICRYICRIVAL